MASARSSYSTMTCRCEEYDAVETLLSMRQQTTNARVLINQARLQERMDCDEDYPSSDLVIADTDDRDLPPSPPASPRRSDSYMKYVSFPH